MSKYDLLSELLGQVPSVVGTYFGMIASGDQSSLITGLLGLLGIGYVVFRVVKRFWLRLFLDRIF